MNTEDACAIVDERVKQGFVGPLMDAARTLRQALAEAQHQLQTGRWCADVTVLGEQYDRVVVERDAALRKLDAAKAALRKIRECCDHPAIHAAAALRALDGAPT